MLLIIFCVLLSVVISLQNIKVGGSILALIIGLGMILYTLANPHFGFYATTLTGFLLFYLQRLLNIEEGLGVIFETLIYASFAGTILQRIVRKQSLLPNLKHTVSILFLVFFTYVLLEMFNPNGASMSGNLLFLRKSTQFILIYFTALNLFTSYKEVRNFFRFFLILSILCGMYGCYQEWFGLTQSEMEFVYADTNRKLIYVLNNGNIRKFSTLNDPTAFGILMAVTSLFGFILMLNAKRILVKAALLAGTFFMVMAMSYSGTRTAFFTFTIGMVMYVLMTINNYRTIILVPFAVIAFVFILFAPIYGNNTLNRIRSTFKISDENKDNSLEVRDNNRKSIQPYIYSHPIGGGLNTTGVPGTQNNPGHALAGFPSDSSLLKIALETGWIGLILQCIIYFVIVRTAVKGYFRTINSEIKAYLLAATVVIFASIVSQYSQVAIGPIPECIFYYSIVAVVARFSNIKHIKSLNI